ncbi:MAG TPA: hypothetical protein VMI35_06795 [Puia sp.]|nr:hypothetical protein [Puia sp.]
MQERLEYLISKLKEQFEQNARPSQMLVTIKLIEAELANMPVSTAPAPQSTKVAVVMPPSLKFTFNDTEETASEERSPVPAPKKNTESMPAAQPAAKPVPVEWVLDPLTDIPTLSHQQAAKELNDVIGIVSTSINDKLKGDAVDLASALKEAPVRELKKAIGVNDRYVFINELFRGDEVMYERSIKTINNFRILPEAEYWMERELKIKLGWDDNREITQRFYQLVRRRFS